MTKYQRTLIGQLKRATFDACLCRLKLTEFNYPEQAVAHMAAWDKVDAIVSDCLNNKLRTEAERCMVAVERCFGIERESDELKEVNP